MTGQCQNDFLGAPTWRCEGDQWVHVTGMCGPQRCWTQKKIKGLVSTCTVTNPACMPHAIMQAAYAPTGISYIPQGTPTTGSCMLGFAGTAEASCSIDHGVLSVRFNHACQPKNTCNSCNLTTLHMSINQPCKMVPHCWRGGNSHGIQCIRGWTWRRDTSRKWKVLKCDDGVMKALKGCKRDNRLR